MSVLNDGELVADRLAASRVRADTGAPLSWVENHIYQVTNGRNAELWPAGGPDPWLTAGPAVHRA